ncbi:class I SAM-dependent methyltransferase [Rhizobium sp. CAU 1783]
MQGSYLTRSARLAGHFLKRPTDLGRYAASATLNPLEAGLPWISWPAIDFLKTFLTRDMSVFEYGSGGSTVFFSRRARDVTAVEHQPEWHAFFARNANPANAVVRLRCVNIGRPENAELDRYVEALDRRYDVILVDGLDDVAGAAGAPLRPRCFAHAARHVRSGGVVILDDAWRYDHLVLDQGAALKGRQSFVGPGPGRWGITRTDVYFC